ncbi:receptor-like protein 43 [Macadamia integrifolia]|uniref:receptor-like protein 43 n=1 Tax=Macadamia integrifolia TaxID=60698 RepID=UPI001C4F0A05|nr:receptor-like protein 43 [Macadamia integrifolia]
MSSLLQLKHEQSCSYNYDTLKSWKPNTNCCSWTGVTCDGHTGHVIGLDLSSSGLCGPIHPTSGLFHLCHLQSLTLFNNSFNGSIPSGFDQLSELTHLDLSWNPFRGQIRANSTLFLLPNLQTLNLSSNIFEGSIPYGFDRLSKLVHLDLHWNSFDGQIHANSSIFHLPNLQSLDLSGNNFEGSIPYGFDRLYKLTHLALSENYFVGQIPLEISRLTNLVSLDLSFNTGLKLEKPNLRTLIHNLSSLIELDLDWVNMSDYDKNYWYRSLSSMLPNLQRLSLSNCSLSGPMDASLSNLHFLSELNVGFNNLSFMSIQELLGRLPSLRVLILSSTGLHGELPDNFFSLQPDLQDLYLSYNNLLSGNLPEFPHVNSLRYLGVISTPLCRKLPKSINNLKLLEALSNPFLFEGPIPSSFANLTNLHSLDLSDNSLTGQIPPFANPTNFLLLNLSYNSLTGQIPSFANLIQLYELDLSYNNLTGQIDSFFKDGDSNIRHIVLRNNLLQGPIPTSACSGETNLEVLDLSYNKLSGVIPKCSGPLVIGNLSVLNLEQNNLHGPIPDAYTKGCKLQIFKVNGNQLQGKLPTSFENCKDMELLDVGNNQLSDTFPFWLQSLPQLRVLVLQANKFYGPIKQKYSKATADSHSPFPLLHM